MQEIAAAEGAVVVAICNKLESEIVELEDDEKLEFLPDMGMEEPGLIEVIRAGYELLNLQTYFTAGHKEVRAWTVKVGATAPEAAGVIHTDFQKGFIRAELSATTTSLRTTASKAPKMPGAGAWRVRTTSSRTATSSTSVSTSNATSGRDRKY